MPPARSVGVLSAVSWRPYAQALAAVALAALVRRLLDPWLGTGYPFITLFVAVAYAAARCGRGPALAAILASLVTAVLSAEPVGELTIATREHRYGLVLFAVAATALALLVESRQRAVARALAHGEQLQITLASIGDGVITTDAEARVTGLNAVAERLTGWSNAEATGRPLTEIFQLVTTDSAKPVENPALRALREGAAVGLAGDTTLMARDGRAWPIDDSAAPIVGDGGPPRGCVLVFHEISARKAAEEALRAQADALADANRRKEEFLATLAHELRNPLAPIKNAVALLKGSERRPAIVERACATLERQVDTMVRLIDDLIDVSRIDRNTLTLERAHVALAALLDQAVEAVSVHAERAGVDLHLQLPAAPIFVHVDPVRFSQIVSNLLTNACKFTPHGGRVTLAVRADDATLELQVRDSGIGIPPEVIYRVFDMYWQTGRPMEWAETGLGIGLSLVRQIVQLHGGTIVARSDGPGLGSEFTVRMPVVVAPPSVVEPPAAAGITPLAPRRVLVVDDNVDSAESLALLLDLAGHVTAVAHDGLKAIELARDFGPDLILLDIGLPLTNGYDACRAIRALPGGEHLSIVALTGWGQVADRARSRDAGFDVHLVKPVAYETLASLLADR